MISVYIYHPERIFTIYPKKHLFLRKYPFFPSFIGHLEPFSVCPLGGDRRMFNKKV